MTVIAHGQGGGLSGVAGLLGRHDGGVLGGCTCLQFAWEGRACLNVLGRLPYRRTISNPTETGLTLAFRAILSAERAIAHGFLFPARVLWVFTWNERQRFRLDLRWHFRFNN